MTPGIVRRALSAAVSLTSAVALVGGASLAGAAGIPGGSSAAAKPIHPGITVSYGNVTCTVGAVMRERHRVFLAVPASCGGIDLGKTQDGCSAPQSPQGVPVSIQGAKHPGKLVYSSFSQMQLHGVTNPERCYYNDLSLVRVDRRDRARVTAAIPGVGVPQGVMAKLPAKGTALRIGSSSGSAGATNHKGWELDLDAPSAMFTTTDCGSSVTAGRMLVGMLLVLPKGMAPGLQTPPETYNLARSIRYLRHTPGFRHVHLVTR